MADQQRGRSPSAGRQNAIRHTPSPSPHNAYRAPSAGPAVDQSFANNHLNSYSNGFNDQFSSNTQAPFDPNDFLNTSQPQQDQFAPSSDVTQQPYLQAQGISQAGHHSPLLNPAGSNNLSSDFLDPSDPGNNSFDPQFFDATGQDPLEREFLDPQLLGGDQQQNTSIDPSNLMNQMTTHHQTPTPPHMLQPGMSRHSSNSPHVSPSIDQGGWSPGHSRHTSLDPSSAAFPQGLNAGWGQGQQFSGHRRTASDAHSDVSSNFNSPYLGTTDNFEPVDHHSPLLNAQQDPVMFGSMGLENFNISESQQQQQHISPIPSPHMSPRIGPQQHQLPPFTSADNFGLTASQMQNQYLGQSQDMFPGQETFPNINQGNGNLEYGGHASAMSPPEINIQPAPPSRQASFEPPKPEGSEDGLSPPERSRSRNRMRAISDPFHGGSRPGSPANGGHVRSSLSPNSARAISRSPSPSGRGGTGNRRSSTSSVPNRDYILDLADPNRPTTNSGDSPSPGGNRQRTQKHPATFQCSLCPKRFTRAYNLRSHLRTHTDERPFVCSVCGKAFARQHDRKRHEGLHSGEKRFICRGHLKNGDNWGCGRKFARADALGRHFRSEAGRVCIKPLLEEEALEKGNSWDAQASADPNMAGNPGMLGVAPGMQVPGMPMPMGQMGAPMDGYGQPMMAPTGYQLPQVLYKQFPMLAGIQWDQLPAGNEDMEGEVSGRSSYDASSGGEMEDYEGEQYGTGAIANQGWASDTGAY